MTGYLVAALAFALVCLIADMSTGTAFWQHPIERENAR